MNEELIKRCAEEAGMGEGAANAIRLYHARAVAPLVEAAQKAERILASHDYETDYLRDALAPFQQEGRNDQL